MFIKSKDDIIELAEFIHKRIPLGFDNNLDDFKKDFDYRILSDTALIYEKNETLSNEEWHKIYDRNKGNQYIARALMNFPQKVPFDIIDDIVFNTKIVSQNITNFSKQSTFERTLLLDALKHPISNVSVDEIFNHFKTEILALRSREEGLDKLEDIDANVINRICDRLLQGKLKQNSLGRVNDVYFLECVKDKNYLRKLIKSNQLLHEQVFTAISNNVYLDPNNPEDAQIINDCFNIGVNMTFLEKFTPYTNKAACQIYFDEFRNDFNEGNLNPNSEFVKRLQLFAISGNIDAEIEKEILDFADNDSSKNTTLASLYQMILNNSSSSNLLERLPTIRFENLIECLSENKRQKDEFYKKAVDIILYNYNTLPKSTEINIDSVLALVACSRKISLSEKACDFLLQNANNVEPILKILASHRVAFDTVSYISKNKDKINGFKDNSEKINLLSYANLLLKENKTSVEAFNAIAYLVYKSNSHMKEKFCQESYLDDYNVNFEVYDFFQKLENHFDEIVDLLNLMMEMPNISKKEKSILSYVMPCIDDVIAEHEDTEISAREELYLKLQLSNISFDFSNEFCAYINLYENLEELFVLKEKCEKELNLTKTTPKSKTYWEEHEFDI